MEPIVFYDFKPDTEDPNNKIVIKKADFEKLLNKTYAAGYQDGLKRAKTSTSLDDQAKEVLTRNLKF